MSGDRRYLNALNSVEQRVTFRGRVRTDGANPFGVHTPPANAGVSIAYTGVGTATATLVESDGTTAAAFDAIEGAKFWFRLAAVPGAGAAHVYASVLTPASGTITLLCTGAAGAAIEWPADNANNELCYSITAKWTTTTP